MSVLSPADEEWTRKQEKLTRLSSHLTAAGATGLGVMLAAKTKMGKKVLPKKITQAANSGKGDDIRNTVALASMITGAASGRKWAKKMDTDVKVSHAVREGKVTPEQVANMATAKKEELAKALIPSGVVRYPSGIARTRVASFRRGSRMLRPRRRF